MLIKRNLLITHEKEVVSNRDIALVDFYHKLKRSVQAITISIAVRSVYHVNVSAGVHFLFVMRSV